MLGWNQECNLICWDERRLSNFARMSAIKRPWEIWFSTFLEPLSVTNNSVGSRSAAAGYVANNRSAHVARSGRSRTYAVLHNWNGHCFSTFLEPVRCQMTIIQKAPKTKVVSIWKHFLDEKYLKTSLQIAQFSKNLGANLVPTAFASLQKRFSVTRWSEILGVMYIYEKCHNFRKKYTRAHLN